MMKRHEADAAGVRKFVLKMVKTECFAGQAVVVAGGGGH